MAGPSVLFSDIPLLNIMIRGLAIKFNVWCWHGNRLYPVDRSRVNEYGESFESDKSQAKKTKTD